MQAHIFRRRNKLFPTLRVLGAQLSPERIYQLKTDRDVADQFATLVVLHDESAFGVLVLPKFTGIVKQNSSDEKIDVQLWIKRRDRHCNAHHLGGVLR